MTSDTLQFSYEKQTVYFYGPTVIQNDSVTILCNKGWYKVDKEEATLYKQAQIIQKSTLMRGDTLYFHGKKQDYDGRGNVLYKDFDQKLFFVGDRASSSNTLRRTFLTGHAVAMKVKDQDTLYVHADSLFLFKDSLNEMDYLKAYRNVLVYNKSMQAKCDSARFEPKNDKLFLRSKPIVWAQNAELKGERMDITIQDSTLQKVEIFENTSALMELDSGNYYNQISGKEMVAYLEKNELVRTDVTGNAWTIFYPEDEEKKDTLLVRKRMGLNRLYASDLRIYLDSGEVVGITYFDKPDGIFYPMDQIKPEEQFIKGFEWKVALRPKSPFVLVK